MELENGSRVGVVGGGPSGSLFTYFLLEFADRIDLEIEVDIWEPKDFDTTGPGGCNHCGGIISESLVQLLATDGINIPENVVQRGIESYVLHTDLGITPIATPLNEKRIASVHRGGGPRNATNVSFGSFDGYLLSRAVHRGANVIHKRVSKLGWQDDRPTIAAGKDEPVVYDLVVGATGINSAALKLFQGLGFGYQPPTGSKTYISELHLGAETIDRILGNSMHVFLIDEPRVEFAAIIPKGEYATLVVLGDNIDKVFVEKFLDLPVVRDCLPPDWKSSEAACFCLPKINISEGRQLWADRVVIVGDAGVSRLYKDGIGAAYKTAKACATTVVFDGVSADAFQRFYRPAMKALARDNKIGLLVFATVTLFRKIRFLRRGMLRMVEREQTMNARPMSTVLWDSFTGSAPYQEILIRASSPLFLARLGWESMAGLFARHPEPKERIAS